MINGSDALKHRRGWNSTLALAAISVLSASSRQIGTPTRLFLDRRCDVLWSDPFVTPLQRHLEPPLHKCSMNFYGFSKETTMCLGQVLSLAPAPLPSPGDQNRSDIDESAGPEGLMMAHPGTRPVGDHPSGPSWLRPSRPIYDASRSR